MKNLVTTLNAKYIHTNLAIRLLYQLNKERHPTLEWKEFTINLAQGPVAEECARYDLVAFSCYIWNITQTLQVATQIKAINPKTKILLGGPEVSYDFDDVIAHEAVDFIITGEGETPFATFLDLCAQNADNQEFALSDLSFVPGLVFKKNGLVHRNAEAGTFDISAYKDIMPYVDDVKEDLKHKVLYIETSRGCPYKCEFCLASLDNKVRYLPDTHIKSTLLYMMEHGRVIKFLDRTFNIKKVFTLDIFDFILENHRPGNVFQFEITADILHKDIIQYIDEKVPLGLFRFEIGIQSVHKEVNLSVQRKQDFDKTCRIIEQVRHKVELHLDLIVGLPFEDKEAVKDSFEAVFALHPPELQLGFLKFLKGTPMLHKSAEHGYIFDPNPPYQIIESAYLSRADLFEIELLENALEIYWNKDRTRQTLKYVAAKYSIFDFFIGLGAAFSEKTPFHKHNIFDVFEILHDFVQNKFPEDKVLHDLVAIDYYLYPKRRPKVLLIEEISRAEKLQIKVERSLQHTNKRYRVVPISFDYQVFITENRVVKKNDLLVVGYDGAAAPEIIQEVMTVDLLNE